MINTDRLVRRRARLEDAPALFEVFGDPQAMAYWDTLPHADITITERFVRWMATSDGVTSDDFVVELEGTVIGKAGFGANRKLATSCTAITGVRVWRKRL